MKNLQILRFTIIFILNKVCYYYYFVNYYFLDHRLRWHVFDGPLRLPGTFILINSLFLQGIRFFYEDFFEKTLITSSTVTLLQLRVFKKAVCAVDPTTLDQNFEYSNSIFFSIVILNIDE